MIIFVLIAATMGSSSHHDWGFDRITSPEEIVLNRLLQDGYENYNQMYKDMRFFFPSVTRGHVDLIRKSFMDFTMTSWEVHVNLMDWAFDGSREEIDRILKDYSKMFFCELKGEERVAWLKRSIEVWVKYCVVPLKRGDKSKCYPTVKDVGYGMEELWFLSSDAIAQYLRDELVKAHDSRVTRLGIVPK